MIATQLTGEYRNAIEVMSPAISKIINHYIGWGKSEQLRNEELPETEIRLFLEQLDIHYPGASKRKLKLAIRSFITRLHCFRYRVIANQNEATNGNEVWNPLEISYKQFIAKNAGSKIIYRSNENPHPVADLISDWVTQNISEDIYSDE